MISVVFVMLGLLLTISIAVLLIVLSRSSGRDHPSCGRCGYDLSHLPGATDRCPECGVPFLEAGIVPARRGRRPWFLVGGIGLIALTLCLGSGLLTQIASLRAARVAQQRAALARQQATQTLQALAAQGRAEAAEAAATSRPADEAAEAPEADRRGEPATTDEGDAKGDPGTPDQPESRHEDPGS